MIPEKIGRYQIIEELGRGGMATVFRAKDPNFDREVAVKVLPKEFLHDPQFRVRFEREAKTIAALEHASIVPVYDFGEDDGMPYIVMRLMTGESLDQRLRDGPVPLEQAVRITTRIAQALDAAHARGIVHRDLKPGNILFDQYGNAYLSDFGIAHIAQSTTTLTKGGVLGTPAYMSPEQIQGENDIDGRSDIYSLGVLFYQMLSGHAPYQATTPAKLMMMHILEPIPNILAEKPELPPALEFVLEKALAKNPDDRYSTAGDFGKDLNNAMVEQSVPYTSSERTLIGMPPKVKADPGATIVGGQPVPEKSDHALSNAQQEAIIQEDAQTKFRLVPFAVFFIGAAVIIGIAAAGLTFWGFQGNGPLAMLARATPTLYAVAPVPSETTVNEVPTDTMPVPTDTLPPTDVPVAAEESTQITSTPTSTTTPEPQVPIEGGADKIAFIVQDDIWFVNLDGTDLEQISSDGASKTDLRWLSDGTAITYISGSCAWMIDFESRNRQQIACFETGELKSFSPSPDGELVAISLSNELFVVPFDIQTLNNARFRSDLIAMSDCEPLNPLTTGTGASVPVKSIEWSEDGEKLAILFIGVGDGKQIDLIRLLDISSCAYTPIKIAEFPASFFTMENYNTSPYIQNFTYDGYYLFILNSYSRNDGFGHMYVFNTDTFNASLKVNPIDGTCCYRDTQFSPDGRYISFVYQPFEAGATSQLYYIPYGSLGTGMQYDPIPLPDTFFQEPRAKPLPALRPAQISQ